MRNSLRFEPGTPLWHKKAVSASWLQLSLKAPHSALDSISNFLVERGSPGVILKRDEVQAFFVSSEKRSLLKGDIQRFLRGISEIYPGIRRQQLRWKILRERNWNSSWQRFFPPQKVGKSFWITPPWVAPSLFPGRRVIIIEPGMAFGTGMHPTTRCCLEFLEEVATSLTQKNITALDVGTGSGILAIALAKMGVSDVLALDNDAIALKAARLNVRRNRVEGAVRLSNSGPERVRKSFMVVVANLTAETIIELAHVLEKKVSARGYLILSGILKPKAGEVVRQFFASSFRVICQKSQKEWATLLLKKNG